MNKTIGGMTMKKLLLCLCLLTAGCGGDAGMELAAGDGLNALAHEFEKAIGEYHADVVEFDDQREDDVLTAFIARAVADADNDAKMTEHVAGFKAAMRKIRDDREKVSVRKAATMDNVAVLREFADKLQTLALDSLSLRDETRRYFTSWIDNLKRAREQASAEEEAARIAKRQKQQALIDTGVGMLQQYLGAGGATP